MTEQPSRFHASPAQIDAFLRERFAEDCLLNFYQAVGDEVLDEIQTSGQRFRGLKEQAQAKHVYLSGITDVLAHIQDDRYFPARLPKLNGCNRPFNPPRPVKAAPENFDNVLEASSLGAPGVQALRETYPTVPDWARRKMQDAARQASPANPETRQAAPDEPCYRDKAHDPHKWLKGRRQAYCPGTGKETP